MRPKNATHIVELSISDVSAYLAQKTELNFVSGHLSLEQVRQPDPVVLWEVGQQHTSPYRIDASLTVGTRTLSASHSILDRQKQPVARPSSADIELSIHMCVLKAMAQCGFEFNPPLW